MPGSGAAFFFSQSTSVVDGHKDVMEGSVETEDLVELSSQAKVDGSWL